MNEFKGTKGEWKATKQITDRKFCAQIFRGDGLSISVMDFRDEQETNANAQLIADAGNVRQQIDCSLPELLERYKKMEEALKDIVEFNERTFTGMGPDYTQMINQAKKALNH